MLLLVLEHSTPYLVVVGIILATLILGPILAEGRASKLYPLNFLVQNGGIFYLIYMYLGEEFNYSNFYLLSGMGYLGIITYAMILGHWYLVVPKLTEWHLKKALIAFWAVFTSKALSSWLRLLF